MAYVGFACRFEVQGLGFGALEGLNSMFITLGKVQRAVVS